MSKFLKTMHCPHFEFGPFVLKRIRVCPVQVSVFVVPKGSDGEFGCFDFFDGAAAGDRGCGDMKSTFDTMMPRWDSDSLCSQDCVSI